jgi:hypothetical protein
MGAWIKVFEDGSIERGLDSDILNKKASWSKGSLSGIAKVQISEKMTEGLLSVPQTDWHHFDRYIADISCVGKATSQRICRVIQAEIKPQHIGAYLCYNIKDQRFVWASVANSFSKQDAQNVIQITNDLVGKWISLCVSSSGNNFVWIGERGKLNGYK